MATKRLKELLESRKASSRETFGNSSGPGVQAVLHAMEHELEVTVRVHEVRCEYERQKEERNKMAKEVAQLKDEANIAKRSSLSDCAQTMSPGARNSRIFALENMLATSSSTIVSMASQLSEAEERERAFSGRGHWNQIRSLPEAKNMMNHLFNLASSSRCQVWDKEVDCREKDSEIRGLKERIVNLIRQVEMQKMEISRHEKLKKKLMMSKSFKEESTTVEDSSVMDDGERHVYGLRPKGLRNSVGYNSSGNVLEEEDMDTSEESEHYSELDETDDDDDDEWLYSEDFANEMMIPSGPCCSCTKSSSCKTLKCEFRAIGDNCSRSCGCLPKKCSNRASSVKASDGEIISLASHGAIMLLEAAAALSDIGNKIVKPNVPKPSAAPRKKWGKSIPNQLIPVPSSSDRSQVSTNIIIISTSNKE